MRAEIDALTRKLEEEIADKKALEQEFHDYVRGEREKENKRLRTGLIAAGGVILALGSFVWWEILWPAVESTRGNNGK